MLTAIRDRATGVVAWVIIGALVLVFALFGIQSYVGVGSGPVVAVVNGDEISVVQYNNALQNRISQEQQVKGASFDPRQVENVEFKKQVLEQLITEKLLEQLVENWKLRYSDGRVAAEIAQVPEFQKDGKFDKETFRRLIARSGYGENSYYADRKARGQLVQLSGGVSSSGFLTQAELDNLLRLQSEEREIAQVIITTASQQEGLEISDEELNAYYEENKAAYRSPERVKLQYLELNAEAYESDVDVSDEALKAYYEEIKETAYTSPEERKARHILVMAQADASESELAEAKKKIDEARARIVAGEDFAAVAKEVSEDPGSKSSGGDLGFFGKGAMVPEFEAVAFSLAPNTLSEPVKSPFGYHLIEVLEIKGGEVEPFETVQDDVKSQLLQQGLSNWFSDQEQILANETFEQSDTLQTAADKLGLNIQESDWVYRSVGQKGLGKYGTVIDAAYSTEVLDEGNNSQVIKLEDNRVVVVRIAKHEPSADQPLEAVKNRVTAALNIIKAEEKAKEVGEALLAKVKEGADLEEQAEALGARFIESNWYRRGTFKMDRDALAKAFETPVGSAESPSLVGVTTRRGNFAVLALTGVRDGDQKFNDDQRKAMLANMGNQMGTMDLTNFVESVRAAADVKTFDDRL